ncbi:MAG: polyprenyl synthetase family protein [Halothiobacillaceae bacterium]|nr:polyprenyl synthetase family protein [Halothiobacillaceae bacterium]HER35275.1 octaprenyl diphosphate synthase [Halothiobacillaceae bacterium]
MQLTEIRALMAEDMQAVDRVIIDRLGSDVALINQLGGYIVHSGGKRFRPLLHMLTSRALRGEHAELPGAAQMAAVVEFIHTATLLHDDVVDESSLRRGRDTANARFGNAASVLTGDFLYSRAFQMMVEVERPRVMTILADATNRVAEGEVMQLMNIGDATVSEARYMDVIGRKTATLFEAACRLAAVLDDRDEATERALGEYGYRLGVAFQLIDDVLDYRGDESQTGKHVGDDLAEGKPTLPLIVAMARADQEGAAVVREAIESQTAARIDAVLNVVDRTGALSYTAALAGREADAAKQALTVLPDSAYSRALSALADISVQRDH